MEKININVANKAELSNLNGVGSSTAQKIIDYREGNDGFTNVEELKEVKGIGKRTYEGLSSEVTTEDVSEVAEEVSTLEVSFNPSEYGLGKLGEVHLVGEMNDWDPSDKTYSLKEDESGIWRADFAIAEGTEVKIMYDSSSWDEGKYVGDMNGRNIIL